MNIYDIAVIGAGPAGIMAAIRAAILEKDVILIEGNNVIGKKILITGKGRCNITNTASLDSFIEKFGKEGPFLRSAFSTFFNEDLIDFFKSKGLALKSERQGRVFPATDKAASIVEVLNNCLKEDNLKVLYNRRIVSIRRSGDCFELDAANKDSISARKVILATGGASYRATGSTGEGFKIVRRLGHHIQPLVPALVPLKTKEAWVKELQGLSLKNVRITFVSDKKRIVSDIGEFIFTHFGVSGPLVLDLSGRISQLLKEGRKIDLFIDLKPGLEAERLQDRLLRGFKSKGKTYFKNFLKELLPQRLIPIIMRLSGIDPSKLANQITRGERNAIASLLKALPLNITDTLSIQSAMVTDGGVSTKEIDPRTMESRLMPGLYFAGEIIDGCASSGGYNLQQAFSTGYLAGESAANA